MSKVIGVECVKGGTGNCAVWNCECPCHGVTGDGVYGEGAGPVGVDGFVDANPLSSTVAGVKTWHDEMYAAMVAYDPAAARDKTPFGGYSVTVVSEDEE